MSKRDPSFNEKLLQDPINEEEIDELRKNGDGFKKEKGLMAASREPIEDHQRHSEHADTGDEVERLVSGQSPSEDPRSYMTAADHEELDSPPPARRATTGDESITEQRRAAGEFVTEGSPSQRDEDFGDLGMHMRGGIHDSENKPSILDPNED